MLYNYIDLGAKPLRSLLCTILDKPNLGALVKTLKFRELWQYNTDGPTYMQKPSPPSNEIQSLYISKALPQVPERFHHLLETALIEKRAEAEAVLLLLLVPNLRALCLNFEYEDDYQFDETGEVALDTGFLRYNLLLQALNDDDRDSSTNDPEIITFPALDALDIASPCESPWRDDIYPLCVFWDVSRLMGIFTRRKLRHVALNRCRGPLGISKSMVEKLSGSLSLESIAITDSAVADSMPDILKMIKGLQHFQYHVPEPLELRSSDEYISARYLRDLSSQIQ